MRAETQTKNERPDCRQAHPDAQSSAENALLMTNIQPEDDGVEGQGISWRWIDDDSDDIEFTDHTPDGDRPLPFEHVWPRHLEIDGRAPLDDGGLLDFVDGALEAFQLAAVDTVVDRFEGLDRESADVVFCRFMRRSAKQCDAVQLRDLVHELLGDLDAAAATA